MNNVYERALSNTVDLLLKEIEYIQNQNEEKQKELQKYRQIIIKLTKEMEELKNAKSKK